MSSVVGRAHMARASLAAAGSAIAAARAVRTNQHALHRSIRGQLFREQPELIGDASRAAVQQSLHSRKIVRDGSDVQLRVAVQPRRRGTGRRLVTRGAGRAPSTGSCTSSSTSSAHSDVCWEDGGKVTCVSVCGDRMAKF